MRRRLVRSRCIRFGLLQPLAQLRKLPRQRVATLLKQGELIEKATSDPREPNVLYVAWRGDHEGRALQWWLEQLRQPRLAKRLVRGVDLTICA